MTDRNDRRSSHGEWCLSEGFIYSDTFNFFFISLSCQTFFPSDMGYKTPLFNMHLLVSHIYNTFLKLTLAYYITNRQECKNSTDVSFVSILSLDIISNISLHVVSHYHSKNVAWCLSSLHVFATMCDRIVYWVHCCSMPMKTRNTAEFCD